MPTYELAIILKRMTRADTVTVLKRAGDLIFDKGGIIRKIENLGQRPLPHKYFKERITHTQGSYFLFHFDASSNCIYDLKDCFVRDVDVLRASFLQDKPPSEFECTLENELLPPAYRKSVQDLLAAARAKEVKKKTFQKYVKDGEI